MITLCDNNVCTGCGACYSVCGNKAITMNPDKNGFVHPQIDTNTCTECKACTKVCPILNYTQLHNNFTPKGYAGWSIDDQIRKNSSSGGIFPVLAQYILNNNGLVCGASFNNNMQVEHIIIKSKNELYKLIGSKYVQSNTTKIYKEIKQLLNKDSNRPILFSGTPCQIDGLNHYLRKDYHNLYTIDVVCHGTPSPALWEKYRKYVESKNGSQLCDYKFRWKKKSWTYFHSMLQFKNGKNISYDWFRDPWMRLFLSNKCLRNSCYECKYANMQRVSDITLADFWGYKSENKYDKKTDKGISLIICNTYKGQNLLHSIQEQIKIFPRTLDVIAKSQKSLSQPWTKPNGTDEFWEDFLKLPFEVFIIKHYKKAKANDLGAFLSKYGMIKLGLFIRWNVINKIKFFIKKIIQNEKSIRI